MKNIPSYVVKDLLALKTYGNRVDHEEMDDLLPQEKPDIVERAYRVALFVCNLIHERDKVKDY